MSATTQPRNYWYRRLSQELEDLRKRVAVLEGKTPVIDLTKKQAGTVPDPQPLPGDPAPFFSMTPGNIFKI